MGPARSHNNPRMLGTTEVLEFFCELGAGRNLGGVIQLGSRVGVSHVIDAPQLGEICRNWVKSISKRGGKWLKWGESDAKSVCGETEAEEGGIGRNGMKLTPKEREKGHKPT